MVATVIASARTLTCYTILVYVAFRIAKGDTAMAGTILDKIYARTGRGIAFADCKLDYFVTSAHCNRYDFAPPATPTARAAIVARARARRWSSLRPALHVRVDDETDRFVPRRNRSLQRGPASRRTVADSDLIAIVDVVASRTQLVIDGQVIELVVAFRALGTLRSRACDIAITTRPTTLARLGRSTFCLLDSVRRPRPRPRRRRGRPRLRSDASSSSTVRRRPVFIRRTRHRARPPRAHQHADRQTRCRRSRGSSRSDAQRLRGIRQWFSSTASPFARPVNQRSCATNSRRPASAALHAREPATRFAARIAFLQFRSGGWTNFPIGFALVHRRSRARPTVIRSILGDRADPGFRRVDARDASTTFAAATSPAVCRLVRHAVRDPRVVRVLRAADVLARRPCDPLAARRFPASVALVSAFLPADAAARAARSCAPQDAAASAAAARRLLRRQRRQA